MPASRLQGKPSLESEHVRNFSNAFTPGYRVSVKGHISLLRSLRSAFQISCVPDRNSRASGLPDMSDERDKRGQALALQSTVSGYTMTELVSI